MTPFTLGQFLEAYRPTKDMGWDKMRTAGINPISNHEINKGWLQWMEEDFKKTHSFLSPEEQARLWESMQEYRNKWKGKGWRLELPSQNPQHGSYPYLLYDNRYDELGNKTKDGKEMPIYKEYVTPGKPLKQSPDTRQQYLNEIYKANPWVGLPAI